MIRFADFVLNIYGITHINSWHLSDVGLVCRRRYGVDVGLLS